MNKRTVFIIAILIIVFGSFTKLYYIHYTETWERQHDVISFAADEGHAYYIQYLYENKALPDFDPREKWGFFQPPLHHIVSAAVLGVSKLLGATEKRAQENIQVFTCIYMILLSVFSVLFYYAAGGDGKKNDRNLKPGVVITAFIVAFHPIYILLSGSINNDALALILSVVSLAIASAWYEKPSYVNTILLALSVGMAMLAKLTGGLVAVPIGILIVIKCLGIDSADVKRHANNVENNADTEIRKHKAEAENKASYTDSITLRDRLSYFLKYYLLKLCVFAAIVFPVGLYWSIRNKIKWDMPINYIPPVGENFPESTTFLSRLIDVRTKSVYPYLKNLGNEYDEFNVILLMLKSSLFGEYNYSEYGRLINLSSKILFITAIILIIICIYATIKVMTARNGAVPLKWKVLLFGTYITYLLAYLCFALSSSNFSAGDFRYSAICILCEAIFLGLYTDTHANPRTRCFITSLSILFAGSSFVTYIMLGLRS